MGVFGPDALTRTLRPTSAAGLAAARPACSGRARLALRGAALADPVPRRRAFVCSMRQQLAEAARLAGGRPRSRATTFEACLHRVGDRLRGELGAAALRVYRGQPARRRATDLARTIAAAPGLRAAASPAGVEPTRSQSGAVREALLERPAAQRSRCRSVGAPSAGGPARTDRRFEVTQAGRRRALRRTLRSRGCRGAPTSPQRCRCRDRWPHRAAAQSRQRGRSPQSCARPGRLGSAALAPSAPSHEPDRQCRIAQSPPADVMAPRHPPAGTAKRPAEPVGTRRRGPGSPARARPDRRDRLLERVFEAFDASARGWPQLQEARARRRPCTGCATWCTR